MLVDLEFDGVQK